MTQRFSLYQDLWVRENLEFVARLYGVPDPRGPAREMIKRLGLTGREEQLARELSGGWKYPLGPAAIQTPHPPIALPDWTPRRAGPKGCPRFSTCVPAP